MRIDYGPQTDPLDDGTLFGAFEKRLGHLVVELGRLELTLLKLVMQLHRHALREAGGGDPEDDELLSSLIANEEAQWAKTESKQVRSPLTDLVSAGESLTKQLPLVHEAFDEMRNSGDHLSWANFSAPYQPDWPQDPAAFFKRISDLADHRNHLIHSSWEAPGIGFRANRDEKRITTIETTSEGLDALADEAALLDSIAYSFWWGLGVTRGPRPRRSLGDSARD